MGEPSRAQWRKVHAAGGTTRYVPVKVVGLCRLFGPLSLAIPSELACYADAMSVFLAFLQNIVQL